MYALSPVVDVMSWEGLVNSGRSPVVILTDPEQGESDTIDVVSQKGGMLVIGSVPIFATDQRPTPKRWTSSDAVTWRFLAIHEEDALDSNLNSVGSDDRLVVAVRESDLDHVDARVWTSGSSQGIRSSNHRIHHR